MWQRWTLRAGIVVLLGVLVLVVGTKLLRSPRTAVRGRATESSSTNGRGSLEGRMTENSKAPDSRSNNLSPPGSLGLAGASSSAQSASRGPGSQDPAVLREYRAKLLGSPYGSAPIAEVLNALLNTSGGPDVQTLMQVLALRKEEALPLVKEKLRSGTMWEMHVLTKFLRNCPWPETGPELLAIVSDSTQNWLARQGAVYALAATGDVSYGSAIVNVLAEPKAPKNLQMAAIATLARLGYRDGVEAIRPFWEKDDLQLRIYAARALTELGQPCGAEFLLNSTRDADYVVREEAAGALWTIPGDEAQNRLSAMAASDPHEAVRDSAARALLMRRIHGCAPAGKLAILTEALGKAERLTSLWIVRTILDECGEEGRAYLGTLAVGDGRLAERARACLVVGPRGAGTS